MNPVMAPVIAGNVPVTEVSRTSTPLLVIPAATFFMAGCTTVGRVNCAKSKVTDPVKNLSAMVLFKRILKTWALAPVNMAGVHVESYQCDVTVQAGLFPMLKEPESVMRMAELALENNSVTRGNLTVTVVVVPLIWEPRVMTGAKVVSTAGITAQKREIDARRINFIGMPGCFERSRWERRDVVGNTSNQCNLFRFGHNHRKCIRAKFHGRSCYRQRPFTLRNTVYNPYLDR